MNIIYNRTNTSYYDDNRNIKPTIDSQTTGSLEATQITWLLCTEQIIIKSINHKCPCDDYVDYNQFDDA